MRIVVLPVTFYRTKKQSNVIQYYIIYGQNTIEYHSEWMDVGEEGKDRWRSNTWWIDGRRLDEILMDGWLHRGPLQGRSVAAEDVPGSAAAGKSWGLVEGLERECTNPLQCSAYLGFGEKRWSTKHDHPWYNRFPASADIMGVRAQLHCKIIHTHTRSNMLRLVITYGWPRNQSA